MYLGKLVPFLIHFVVSSPVEVSEGRESIYALFKVPTFFWHPKNLADNFKRRNYANIQIHVFIGSETADSRLANLIVRDCFQRNSLVVSGSIGCRAQIESSHQVEAGSRLENLILVYDSVSSIDLVAIKTVFGDRWNPRARIIVCVEKIERNKTLEVLEYFWKHDLLNVALTVKSRNSDLEDTFIYNPFIPVKISDGQGTAERLNPQDSMFPDKLTDLYNRSIPISVYSHYPKAILTNYTDLTNGTDVEVLRALSKKLNFSVDLKTAPIYAPSYTVRLNSGEKVGMIGDVLVNRSDIVMNAQYMDSTIGRRVEITYPTLQTGYCVLVPKAKVMPMIVRMLSPFPKEIWMGLVGVVGFLVVCLILMGEKSKLIKVSEILLRYSIVKIPERNFKRIFFISFIWWAYLMACIYQANFINELILPKYYKDLDTLEELYDSNLPLFVGDSMMEVLNNSEVPIFRKLTERAVEHLVFQDCKAQLWTSSKVACGADEYVSDILAKVHTTNDRTVHLTHRVKECLSLHWDVYVAKYGFILLDKFNFYIQSILEAGLYNKWVEDVVTTTGRNISIQQSRTARKLTIKHCEGPFGVLLIGCAISMVAFVLELAVFRLSVRIA